MLFVTQGSSLDSARKRLLGLLLIVVTLLVYMPVFQYPFVSYDDYIYVTDPPQVREGLNWENFKWAMTNLQAGFWHPLTWLSHLLDGELFELNPAGHHLTNVLLHLTSVAVLFWVLEAMTGALWCSAFAAALFALHPLNVESVAWVAERKNVLSTLFWVLTMGAYLGYVRKPVWKRYWGLMGVFVLGLMAKPMLVTLPCVFLLLDYWPLARFGKDRAQFRERVPRLVVEKLPFFIPVGIISLLTIKAESVVGALPTVEDLPMAPRIFNAVVAYALYLKKMVWPLDLAVLYPHPGTSVELWAVVSATVLLVSISLLVWRFRRQAPYLVVGWLWYLGALVPVSGLVQVGGHAMADRYAYVPLIGIFIMLAWGAAQAASRLKLRREWLAAAALGSLVPLWMVTYVQVGYWRDSASLFEHALAVTEENAVAHYNLATALAEKEEWEMAIPHLHRALEILPSYASARINLGSILARQDKMDDAMRQFEMAIEANPESDLGYHNLGLALLEAGRVDEGIDHLSRALKINPDYASAHLHLGLAALQKGNRVEAVELFRQALALRPNFARAHYHLGTELLNMGHLGEAQRHLLTALQEDPGYTEAYVNLAVVLKNEGNFEDALVLLRKALEMAPGSAEAHNNMGTLLAVKGDLDKAEKHFSRTLEIDPSHIGAYSNLGYVFSQQGRLDEAIESYRQATALDPHQYLAHNNLGLALEKKGLLDEAADHFSEALNINPDYAEARDNLARLRDQ